MKVMNDRIVIDPRIAHGEPVIRGTRVPVSRILGGLASGMSREQVMDEYGISVEDVAAALAFAGQIVDEQTFHPLPAA